MNKFNYFDFAQPDFDVDSFISPVDIQPLPKEGVPINAYKRFKAIDKYGNTYYMSGVRRGY